MDLELEWLDDRTVVGGEAYLPPEAPAEGDRQNQQDPHYKEQDLSVFCPLHPTASFLPTGR